MPLFLFSERTHGRSRRSQACSSPRHRAVIPIGYSMLLLATLAAPAAAIVCTVPGSHGRIRQAIEDLDCTEIHLASQTYLESLTISRTLDIAGSASGTTTLRGSIAISGAVVVGLTDLLVTGCADARITATGGASVSGTGLEVLTSGGPACPLIFGDGFESANTSAWSSSVP